jgi:hypothetical protein
MVRGHGALLITDTELKLMAALPNATMPPIHAE